MSFEECKKLIQEFLRLASENADIKNAEIDSLATFNFENLSNKEKYGVRSNYRDYKNRDKNGDPHYDSSRLARLIYYILWGNHEYTDYKLSNLTNADTCFDAGEKTFSGDTLITTVAFDGDTTIGNFMILPKNNYQTYYFNQYRGQQQNDKFFEFMKKMKELFDNKDKILEKNENDLDIWENLLKVNKDYFNDIDNFNHFVEFFMLDGWKELADENKEKMENFDKEKMENFVKQRSERICERLKKLF